MVSNGISNAHQHDMTRSPQRRRALGKTPHAPFHDTPRQQCPRGGPPNALRRKQRSIWPTKHRWMAVATPIEKKGRERSSCPATGPATTTRACTKQLRVPPRAVKDAVRVFSVCGRSSRTRARRRPQRRHIDHGDNSTHPLLQCVRQRQSAARALTSGECEPKNVSGLSAPDADQL